MTKVTKNLLLSLAIMIAGLGTANAANKVLTIYTYDSFVSEWGPGPKLEAAFEAIPDLFFLMNEDSSIIYYHANNEQNLYIPPEKFLGKSVSEIK